MLLKTLQKIALSLLCATTVCAMDDAPEPMDVEQADEKPAVHDQQPNSLLLMLPDEVQQQILLYVATPTFWVSDWKLKKKFLPFKLVCAIEDHLIKVDFSISKAVLPIAFSCKQLLNNTRIALNDNNNIEWIRTEYTIEKIVQALQDALSHHKTSLNKIISSENGSKLSVLQEAVYYDSESIAEVVQIILRASNDPQKLLFYTNSVNHTVLHCAAARCNNRKAIIMILEAAGDKAKELFMKKDDGKELRSAYQRAVFFKNGAFIDAAIEFFDGGIPRKRYGKEEDSSSCTIV